MSAAQAIFEEIVEANGWDREQQVPVLLEYVGNQDSPEAFEDFLMEHFGSEYNADGIDALAESDPDELVDAVLTYIGNQQSDDAFEDFLVNYKNHLDHPGL